MERILSIAITLVLTFPVFSQETGYEFVQPTENQSNTEQTQYSSTRGSIAPHFSFDYLHGNVMNAKELDKNGSNYIQLCATMNTGTQDGSFFNCYKSPEVGISGLVGFLGEKDVLGTVFALYPTWRYTFFKTKSIGLNVKLGSGFAWFTKPYNKFDNTENKLIGSHINNITEIGLDVWFQFHPQWKIDAGTSFLHFSNGHTAIPNKGLNDITARLGVIYSPGELNGKSTKHREMPELDDSWKKNIVVSLGRHELAYTESPTDGPSYNVYKLGCYFSKRLSKINEVKFGSTISYYQSYYTFIHLTDYYNHLQHLASTVVALQIGHEFLINRFGFDTDLGIKVVDPFYRDYFLERDNSLWYKSLFAPKVGFKFYPIWNSYDKQRLALGMYIKTNGLQADFVEYSLSYSF